MRFLYLAGGLGVFEQHVVYASGQGALLIQSVGERVRNSKRGFPRWGKPSGAARKYPRQDPLKKRYEV